MGPGLRRDDTFGSVRDEAALGRRLGVPVRPVETVGWNGDALEAQAFAYLAVRSVCDLPLTLPSTTGVPRPMRGGRRFKRSA